MATTIDRTLFDRLVRQQIAVGRYAENQAYDIIRLLNRADKELIDKITARGEDGTFTKARLDALLRETRSMVDKTYRDLFDVTKAEMDAFAPHAAEVAASTLASQLPVSWSPVAISDEQLISIVNKTPISIGPDKKLLLEEVFQSMAANKEESIRGAIRLGMVQGETIDQITRRLKGTRANQYKDGILEGSRKSMEAITRTIVQHTNNVAVQSTFEKNKKVLDGWIYVATLDSRTCSVCFSVSGKQYPLGEGPLPVRHVRCRCFQAPAIKSWKDLGIDLPEFGPAQRASKDGYVSADISFHDWLKGQDKKTQVELLGKTRAQMFAEGKIKLDKFTDSSGKLLTLEQLKAKQADNVFRGASANQYLLKDIGPLNPKKIGSWIDDAKIPPVENLAGIAKSTKGKLIPTGYPPGSMLEVPATAKASSLEPLLDHSSALYSAGKGTAQAKHVGYIHRSLEISAEEKKYSVSVQFNEKGGIIGATSMHPISDSIRIEHLGGLGGGAGSSCLLSAIKASEKAGFGGAITLTPVANSVSYYDSIGFVPKLSSNIIGETWLSPEAASVFKKSMKNRL